MKRALPTLLLLFAYSCNNSEVLEPNQQEQGALTFMTYVDEASTRSATRGAMQDSYTQFRVWVAKDIPSGAQWVMNGYTVEYLTALPDEGGATWGDGNSEVNGLSYWSYDHITGQTLKYWDVSATAYTFRAIAPVCNFADGKLELNPDDNNIRFVDLPGNVTEDGDNPNYIVAVTQRQNRDNDGTPLGECAAANLYDYDCVKETVGQLPASHTPVHTPPSKATADVPLRFHHIYSTVEFRVYADAPITLRDAKIEVCTDDDGIPVNGDAGIPSKGDYSASGNAWSVTEWETLFAYESYLDISGKPIPVERDNAVTIAKKLEIPQAFPTDTDGGRKIKVTFQDNATGEFYTGYVILTTEVNKPYYEGADFSGWQQDKTYVYILKIVTGSGDDDHQVILFAVDMDMWKWQMGSETEEEQTNW